MLTDCLTFGAWSVSMCDTFDCTIRRSRLGDRQHQVRFIVIASSTFAASTERLKQRSTAPSWLVALGAARPATIASAQRSSIVAAGIANGHSSSRIVAARRRCYSRSWRAWTNWLP